METGMESCIEYHYRSGSVSITGFEHMRVNQKAPYECFIGRRWIFLTLYLIWVIQRSEHLLKIYSRADFRWRFICSIIQISFRGHLVSFSVMYGPLTVPRFEFEIINSWNIGAYLIQLSFESSESCSGPGGW